MERSAARKKALIYVGVLLVIAGLICYAVYQFTRKFATSLTTLKTQEITEYSIEKYQGYIFRDETVVYADEACVIDYSVQNGEKIGVGDRVAGIYPTGEMPAEKVAEIQGNINALDKRIDLLSSKKLTSGGFAGATKAHKSAEDSYIGALASISDGDYPTADIYTDQFLEELIRYKTLTGQILPTEDLISSLRQRKTDLISSVGSEPKEFISDRSAYFYTAVDGYEDTFSSSVLTGARAESLLDLIGSAEARADNGRVIGKTVNGSGWYLAVPADTDFCAGLSVGGVYSVTFTGEDDIQINMTVSQILLTEEISDTAVAVFYTDVMPKNFTFKRMQSITVMTDATKGYRVPNTAIYQIDGQMGVYILDNSVVSFRRIGIVRRYDKYSIVMTKEEDGRDNPGASVPYLSVNDLIITEGGDLYEGKIYY